jgi:hypothetical protein
MPNQPAERASTRPPPVIRAWHVLTRAGGGQTVAAHQCSIRNGVLSFRNQSPTNEQEMVVVRAFAMDAWSELDLIDTPVTAAVQVRSVSGLGRR